MHHSTTATTVVRVLRWLLLLLLLLLGERCMLFSQVLSCLRPVAVYSCQRRKRAVGDGGRSTRLVGVDVIGHVVALRHLTTITPSVAATGTVRHYKLFSRSHVWLLFLLLSPRHRCAPLARCARCNSEVSAPESGALPSYQPHRGKRRKTARQSHTKQRQAQPDRRVVLRELHCTIE